jgi:tetratricopeptide (TPR) repeat protein/sugar lactone lactonase YvrE
MRRNRTARVLVVAALISALRLVRAQQPDAEIGNPTALAFDHTGNLFVADHAAQTIFKLTPDGTRSVFVTGVRLSEGNGLAFDAADNLFVLSPSGEYHVGGTILKFSPNGSRSTFATAVGLPYSLSIDSSGNLFVSDWDTGSIYKLTPKGEKSTFATTEIAAKILACDQAGNLFAGVPLKKSIFKYEPGGAKSDFATDIIVNTLAIDKAGNVYVGDTGNTIFKFTPTGAKSDFAEVTTSPRSFAFDASGNLFVVESFSGAITKFTADGAESVFLAGRPQPEPEEEEAESETDSSAGLPQKYAKDYLIAHSTMSPDKKFAVIYPNEAMAESASEKELKNYLVALQPFAILKPLDTKRPYFEHESHGGLSAEWSDDSSVGLITLDSKWGPGDVLLVEFHNGKLSRMTNISRKARDLLVPNWRKAKAERYNEYNDFVFIEDASFKLDGTSRVLIEAEADTTPNDLGLSERAWRGYIAAIWDIPQARLTSTKVSGHRRKKRELEPDEAGMYDARGEDKKNESDFEGAIADYTRAIELYPKYSEAYRERGIAKAKKKERNLDGAIADLDRAIKLDPNDAVAYAGRADVRGKRKQYDAAITDIQKAIDLDLVKAPYYVALAWYELLNRKPRQAIEASLKALEWSPSDAVTIKTNLAHGYLLDNQFDKAKAIYLENKDAKLDDKRSFTQAVLNDFKELQDAGITHPDMEKIKALLSAETQVQ